jgi:MerR family transcriptional regulator, light-induced transcriptional regulator
MGGTSRQGLSISATSLLLGIPEPTIRSWERRYGVPLPSRTTGKHRRYTVEDLDQLRDMRDEISAGRRAQEASELVRKRAMDRGPGREYIAANLDAAMHYDAGEVRRLLDAAQTDLGLENTIQSVALPTMREIGMRWEAGKCDIANEHLASHEVRSWLSLQVALATSKATKGQVVMACGPKDQHSLGLEAFSVVLTTRGWTCRVLGAAVPAPSLLKALRTTNAEGVVITSHIASNRRATLESIHAAAELKDLHIFYAGNAFSSARSRNGVPGEYLGTDLLKAADVVDETLRGRH